MHAVCPECKNTIDLSEQGEIAVNDIVECSLCGMTLMVTAITDNIAAVEIVDEGK